MPHPILTINLHRYSLDQLTSLLHQAHADLAQTAPGGPARRAALATIETLQGEIARRMSDPQLRL
ncbi:MAG: hypothetical protein AAF501_00115 [Pseudomonadota bacterium]